MTPIFTKHDIADLVKGYPKLSSKDGELPSLPSVQAPDFKDVYTRKPSGWTGLSWVFMAAAFSNHISHVPVISCFKKMTLLAIISNARRSVAVMSGNIARSYWALQCLLKCPSMGTNLLAALANHPVTPRSYVAGPQPARVGLSDARPESIRERKASILVRHSDIPPCATPRAVDAAPGFVLGRFYHV